jgi:RimJ/RimL family protein N-acetyltransferase
LALKLRNLFLFSVLFGRLIDYIPAVNYSTPESLQTDRLLLRFFREEDWKDLHKYYSDETCMRYTVGRALTEGETWRAMAAMIGHWQLRHYGSYALEEKASHRVIGVAGLDYPNDWPEPEIKWGLIRDFWGKGYASEAVRAIKKMWIEYLPELRLISLIHPDNANSINLAQAVGAYFERPHEFRGDTWSIYRHTHQTIKG